MSKDFLSERKKALEESFFAKENAKLLEHLKEEKDKSAARESLAKATGDIGDDILDKLHELGVEPDTWAAVSIAPLVEVAWANGKVEDAEREAVLSAAASTGIDAGSPSALLLGNWLSRRPDGRLLEVWGAYIVSICASLDETERDKLKSQVLGRARDVAEAAGGFLGLGNKISAEERVVLEELSKAFKG